jgi:hypothetical protein
MDTLFALPADLLVMPSFPWAGHGLLMMVVM